MSTFDDVVSGLNVGMGLRGAYDKRQDAKALKKQQALTRGLREAALALGGQNKAEQTLAGKKLLAHDPAAHKAFTDQFDNLSSFQQVELENQTKQIGSTATELLNTPDADLFNAIQVHGQSLTDSGKGEAANLLLDAAVMAETDPQGAKQLLKAIQVQGREVENVANDYTAALTAQVAKNAASLTQRLKEAETAFDQTNLIRKDVNALSKTFEKSQAAYNKVEAVFDTVEREKLAAGYGAAMKANPKANQSAIDSIEAYGDMALVFNYMKVLDENSTVREGEYATAKNTTSAGKALMNLYNQAMDGVILNDDQRNAIRKHTEGLYKTAKKQNTKDLKRYRLQANRLKLRTNEIFTDESNSSGSGQASTTSGGVAFTRGGN